MSPIDRAAQLLRSGGLVAFPTETVYGLGADATNPAAIERIYRAKGRPPTNPCIVHIASAAIARRYALRWPETADALAARFWPGPLTLVLLKRDLIPNNATASRPTVGLRVPDHPVALELLTAFDGPVAAPSANRSNKISPTTADHVRSELGPSVDVILDGGECTVGIESTVLDLSGYFPTILRPGMVTREQLETVIGPVRLAASTVGETESAASPGQQPVHYAPDARAYRFERQTLGPVLAWIANHPAESWAVLTVGHPPADLAVAYDRARRAAAGPRHLLEMPQDPHAYARKLYATLRDLDRQRVRTFWIELPPDKGPWAAVRDRLTRATREPA